MQSEKIILNNMTAADAPAVEIKIQEQAGRVTITFSSDGSELPPRVIIENIGGGTKLYLWDDSSSPISHRTVISPPST